MDPINNNKISYNIDAEGSIVVSKQSMNQTVFELAQSCDKDGNLKLENNEIKNFIKKLEHMFSKSQFEEAIDETTQLYEYGNSSDGGKRTVKYFLSKNTDEQLVAQFNENNELVSLVLKKENEPNLKIDFVNKYAFKYDENGSGAPCPLTDKTLQRFEKMVTEPKETGWFDKMVEKVIDFLER